ncbi:hypothetical protein F3Y22_tig00110264pilonHSYRG00044 [Hibiscus syriacus]|uniref:RNase H type-1 domain-containing protein n=1 Tax=Hibiscus syriacus TaxID=106335 RepID=A0A6A3B5H4_HIBSY|nr:hypothetical protein F3Y22_tig00110264pilonHSYRG00044 [Hibiscus syriacus]
MTNDTSFLLCGASNEIIAHVLRDCMEARAIWTELIYPDRMEHFLSMDIADWRRNQRIFEPKVLMVECHRSVSSFSLGGGRSPETCSPKKLRSCENMSRGVVRDSEGRWIGGFAKVIGVCSALEAEIRGVLQGLALAWDLGLRSVILEIDSRDT